MGDNCPECRKYREEGASFCGACGNMLDCPECDGYRRNGAAFCGNCGRRLYVPYEPPKKSGLMFKLSFLLFLFVSIYAIADILIIAVGFFDVLDFVGSISYALFILVPYPYAFLVFSGAGTQLYWVFLVFMIIMSFSISVKELITHTGSLKSLKDEEKITKTSPFWVAVMWPGLILLHLIMVYLISFLTGDVMDTPPTDDIDVRLQMFVLASAGVWEEIVSRMLIIGVPMAIIAAVNGKKDSWLNLWGGFGMSKVSMVLMIISALVFGFAHMEGWGYIKVIPAAIFGLGCGYLYVKFGLHAAIMLHLINDYASVFYWAGYPLFGDLMLLVLMAAGIVSLVILAYKGYGFAKNFGDQPVLPPSVEKDG